MARYAALSPEQLKEELSLVENQLQMWTAKGLKLDMSRGKPGMEQLNMVSVLFPPLSTCIDYTDETVESRNYGELLGLPSARRLFADFLDCKPSQVFVGGNSSLQMMYDTIAKAFTHGLLHSPRPWCKEEKLKWICPVPGYDRHFRICESFGIEMISVPLRSDGPDMDMVEELIKDPTVKGMWNVPKYTNPDGIIYSEEIIRRLAAMKPAAPDFTLFWDCAYRVHDFDCDYIPTPDILSLCEEYGNPDMPIAYASTSKITYAGSGICCLACSEANLAYLKKLWNVQIICYDKINQLRHALLLKDKANTLNLMKKHAEILRPKFHLVFDMLDKEIVPLDIAHYYRTEGGYFVSLHTKPGLAKRTIALCQENGIVMTPAGAAFPYGKDPKDNNIRIAPTYPPLEELNSAMRIFCLCLRKAALEQLLEINK